MAVCLSWASKVPRRRYSDSRKASSNPSLPEATAVSVRLASPRGPVDRHLRAPAEGGSASKLSAHDGQKLLWMREDLLKNAALRAVLVPGGVSFTDRFCLVLEEVAWFLGGSGDEIGMQPEEQPIEQLQSSRVRSLSASGTRLLCTLTAAANVEKEMQYSNRIRRSSSFSQCERRKDMHALHSFHGRRWVLGAVRSALRWPVPTQTRSLG